MKKIVRKYFIAITSVISSCAIKKKTVLKYLSLELNANNVGKKTMDNLALCKYIHVL